MTTDDVLKNMREMLAEKEPEALALAEQAKSASDEVDRLRRAIAALEGMDAPARIVVVAQEDPRKPARPTPVSPFIPALPSMPPYFPQPRPEDLVWPTPKEPSYPIRIGDFTMRDGRIVSQELS